MSAVTANKKIVVVLGEQGCGMTLLLNRIAVKAEDAESYDLSCRISGMSMIVGYQNFKNNNALLLFIHIRILHVR